MTTLAISLCALQCGYAEALPASFSPNVTIRGDLLSLRRLPFLLKDGECPNRDCTVRIAPINVSVVVKGYGVVSLVFSEAEDTRLIRRELPNQSVNDIAQRPVLLRGVGFRRHLGERGERIEFPVAGTIYQDGSVPQLEIALSHLNRRAPDRVVVARASLAESLHGNGVDGRAIHASSYAFATASCGTHDSGRQSSQLRVPGVALRSLVHRTFAPLTGRSLVHGTFARSLVHRIFAPLPGPAHWYTVTAIKLRSI
jgi:hypothetical protein